MQCFYGDMINMQYKHHWGFPFNKKIHVHETSMLTCCFVFFYVPNFTYM